jgi:hypothetical protein
MTVARVVDGETYADSTYMNTLVDAINGTPGSALGNTRVGTYNVRDYEATGDGVTDDTPFVQDAVDAAIAALDAGDIDHAFIDFVGGRFLLDPVDGFFISSMPHCVFIDHDNVTVRGDGATIVFRNGHANDCVIFSFNGFNVPEGPSAALDHWVAYHANFGTYPVYAMSPVAKGDGSITLTTPAQASNFAAGDAILIRSGQTIDGGAGNTEPDAEWNEVVSANTGTGVIKLKWPTTKAYVQEYFITGTDGPTSTSVTANLASFGVQNGEPAVLRNCRVTGLDFDLAPDAGRVWAVYLSQIIGGGITDCTATITDGSIQNGGNVRFFDYERNTIHKSATLNAETWVATNTGTSDVSIRNNTFSSDSQFVGFLHIHEGSARVQIQNNRMTNVPSATTNHGIQVFGRGHDIVIADNYIDHQSSVNGVPILTGTDTDGITVRNNKVIGLPSTIGSRSGLVRGNEGRLILTQAGPAADIQQVSYWVYHDDAEETTAGSIPPVCLITSVTIWVAEAFDGTNPRIAAGSGVSGQRFIPLTNIGSLGDAPVTRTADVGYYQNGSADRPILWTYLAGGSAVGKALCTICYSLVPQGVGV